MECRCIRSSPRSACARIERAAGWTRRTAWRRPKDYAAAFASHGGVEHLCERPGEHSCTIRQSGRERAPARIL